MCTLIDVTETASGGSEGEGAGSTYQGFLEEGAVVTFSMNYSGPNGGANIRVWSGLVDPNTSHPPPDVYSNQGTASLVGSLTIPSDGNYTVSVRVPETGRHESCIGGVPGEYESCCQDTVMLTAYSGCEIVVGAGCPLMMQLTKSAAVGTFVSDAALYYAPGKPLFLATTLEAGKSGVMGMTPAAPTTRFCGSASISGCRSRRWAPPTTIRGWARRCRSTSWVDHLGIV